MEYCRLRSIWRLREYLKWPGVERVCALERVWRIGGVHQRETVLAITTLTPKEAPARRLLSLAGGHWDVENGLH